MALQDKQYNTIHAMTLLALLQILVIFAFQLAMYFNVFVYIFP
jgi:hypothetical protein